MVDIRRPKIDPELVLKTAGMAIGEKLRLVSLAEEGADHMVIKVARENGQELIVKTGPDAGTDYFVLKLLEGQDIKVPRVFGESQITVGDVDCSLAVMECYQGQLLRSVDEKEKPKFMAPLIEEMKKVHEFKSPRKAGAVMKVHSGKDFSWPDFLRRDFNGENSDFDWRQILDDKTVDHDLVKMALERINLGLNKLKDVDLSLLNTDLNQANVFIKDSKLEGIIDWSDAVYGDSLFDFARIRMSREQDNDRESLDEYFRVLDLSDEEKERENLYYLIHVTEYVGRYLHYVVPHMVERQQELLREILKS